MLKVQHVTAQGAAKRAKFTLPAVFDGRVHEGALYHAVRAWLSNQRQGTHATKTRAQVSGGRSKPYKQKGTGRARQGTIRAPHYRGGGVAFGPQPRDHHVDLPRKVRRVAKRSALNARANEGALYVIEQLAFERPNTKQLIDLLDKMDLADRKVLVLTASNDEAVYLSGRNLPRVHVMEFRNASTYEILWSDAVVVDEGALAAAEAAGPTDDEATDA